MSVLWPTAARVSAASEVTGRHPAVDRAVFTRASTALASDVDGVVLRGGEVARGPLVAWGVRVARGLALAAGVAAARTLARAGGFAVAVGRGVGDTDGLLVARLVVVVVVVVVAARRSAAGASASSGRVAR
ncbi:hypothetical protein GCM10023145_15480 [Angustibacter luteus]